MNCERESPSSRPTTPAAAPDYRRGYERLTRSSRRLWMIAGEYLVALRYYISAILLPARSGASRDCREYARYSVSIYRSDHMVHIHHVAKKRATRSAKSGKYVSTKGAPVDTATTVTETFDTWTAVLHGDGCVSVQLGALFLVLPPAAVRAIKRAKTVVRAIERAKKV